MIDITKSGSRLYRALSGAGMEMPGYSDKYIGIMQQALDAAYRAGAEEMREEAARMVETTQETFEGGARGLDPRGEGNRIGLGYATGIRALPIPTESDLP